MQKISIEQAIEQLVKTDPRYHQDAYDFVREALDFTIKQQKKSQPKDAAQKLRHVGGKDLLEGVRLYALEQFGPLACTVLKYWNIRCCEDVGEIVYNMVSMSILKTTDTDSRDDFKNGFDFEEAFLRPFLPTGTAAKSSATRGTKLGSAKSS